MKKSTKPAVLTPDASIIFPYFDETGKIHSIVLRKGKLFKYAVSPTELVDCSLRHFGSSLRGATEGAKSVFGMPISMPPVTVSEVLGMYWFPSKSPSSDDCVWFALYHIALFTSIGEKLTKVELRDGTQFTVHCSHHSFAQKMQRASMLKSQVEARTRAMEGIIPKDPQKMMLLFISKGKTDRNYEVTEE